MNLVGNSNLISMTPNLRSAGGSYSMTTIKPKPKYRSMILHLPIPLADALEYARYLRQKSEGRPVAKKQLVFQALEQFLKTPVP